MELLTCQNCATVYGDANELCPNCDADHAGSGGRVELDVTARAAVSRLGGLYGGILELGGADFVLWCGRGVCLYSDDAGLLWERSLGARVDGVHVAEEHVRVLSGAGEVLLDRRDGSPLDRA